MTRIVRIMFAAALSALAFATAGTQRAQAQIPNSCCTFVLVASGGIPAVCFPITITSSWGGIQQTDVATASTIRKTCAINPTNPCPPATTPLDWFSPDSGATKFTTAGPNPYKLPCNVNVFFVVLVNPITGCLEIHITTG